MEYSERLLLVLLDNSLPQPAQLFFQSIPYPKKTIQPCLFYLLDMDLPISALILAQFQLYGLIFLLGSFSVATLSDLKRMSAQREFTEIWILFFLTFLGYDIYTGYSQGVDWFIFVKWGLIVIFAIAGFTGALFNIASGDMFACLAVLALLPPFFILFFILTLKISQLLLGPFLKLGFGKKKRYPFLPVVTAATVSTVILGFYILDWAGL